MFFFFYSDKENIRFDLSIHQKYKYVISYLILSFPLSLFHPNMHLNLGLQSPHHEIPLWTPPPQCGNSTLGWKSQKWRWQSTVVKISGVIYGNCNSAKLQMSSVCSVTLHDMDKALWSFVKKDVRDRMHIKNCFKIPTMKHNLWSERSEVSR